ncbi:two-component sensor histidine kinase [Mycobacterium sp. CBMA 234]|uniref:sensor histidine kinase n=1 Tax=Mycolicibacterium sp. CBMA 234 TaxID=1918495 RepID=UPI0013912D42|nr:sensor histidine kinase [Mycolicibacterium sp. CBMA 234]MUL65682.1 two-component sensor histidine kinase [Mycolicibacterium sp. CBMA 234]
MGLRVRALLMALLLIATAALAVPLALTLADRRTNALHTERERQLATLADIAATASAPDTELVDRYHQVYGEGALIVDADGRTLATSGLAVTDPGVTTATERALSDAPAAPPTRIMPWDRRPMLAAKGIRRGGELVGAVVLVVNPTTAAHDVAVAWLWIAAGCVVLLGLAIIVAQSLTRWVLRPLIGLERAVDDMAGGIAGQPAQVSGPPELRRFTSAFNAMAQAVHASLDHQRRLIADASHQLRNPLAAIRLRADTLEDHVAASGRPTYESLSGELDRLENLLAQLLRLARAEQASYTHRSGLSAAVHDSTDLDSVAEQRLAFWQTTADGNDQRLRFQTTSPHLTAQMPRHDVEQLLDIALDNALRYSGIGSTVTVSTVCTDAGIDLIVSDDGPGLPADAIAQAATRFWRGHTDSDGTGLGLAIATEIAAAHGGLASVDASPEGGLAVRYHLPAGAPS